MLDTPSGHIVVGLILLATLIGCKVYGLDNGIENTLTTLIGITLGRSLQSAGDGK